MLTVFLGDLLRPHHVAQPFDKMIEEVDPHCCVARVRLMASDLPLGYQSIPISEFIDPKVRKTCR